MLVTGLLQTNMYARALFATRIGGTHDEIDELVSARLKRQEILKGTARNQLKHNVRPLSGFDQLVYLFKHHLLIAYGPPQRPFVQDHLKRWRADAGAYEGLNGGGFAIADFKHAPSIAYQESAVHGQNVQDVELVVTLVAKRTTLGTKGTTKKGLYHPTGGRSKEMDLTDVSWRKAGYSGGDGGGCVEVTATHETASVPHKADEDLLYLLRDSKDPSGPKLAFTTTEWDAFLGVKTLLRGGD